jgi:hypothetical protein
MTSAALEGWQGPSSHALDEIELVHMKVEGPEQLSYAYATLITAHFQMYCRAVHSEAAEALVVSIPDPALATVMQRLLTGGRFLDKGNPTPRNLGQDFGRFGFRLWYAIETEDRRNRSRRRRLGELCEWRNAIVHGDIAGKRESGRLVPRDLTLETCRGWRRAAGELVISIDSVVAAGCQDLGCLRPW